MIVTLDWNIISFSLFSVLIKLTAYFEIDSIN